MKIILYTLFLLAPLTAYAQRGSQSADQSYERIARWIDTVSETPNSSGYYLNYYEKNVERGRMAHPNATSYHDLQPTGYPSPWRQKDWC